MAKKLTIRINADQNNQTVSKIVVFDDGSVAFHNDAAAKARVEFAGESPLCQGGNPQLSFEIDAGKKKSLKVCDGVAGKQYKYTATVEGALPEDPILIFEKSPILIFERDLGSIGGVGGLVIGLVAGALLAYFLARNSKSSRPTGAG